MSRSIIVRKIFCALFGYNGPGYRCGPVCSPAELYISELTLVVSRLCVSVAEAADNFCQRNNLFPISFVM